MAKKETSPVQRLSQESKEDIRRAVEVMNQGGVKRIYEIKQRTDAKALISLVDSETKVQFYVKEVPEVAWDVMELSEKPMTVVFDGGRNLAPNLLAEDGSVAIRITKEAFSKELCMRMKRAVVSTSANISGQPAPRCFSEISEEIKKAVDYISTSRQDEPPTQTASSIIKLGAGGEVTIIR